MNAEVLFENYGLKPYVFFSFSGYPAFQDHLVLYLVIEVFEKDEQELYERFLLTEHLRSRHEPFVPSFVPNKEGNYISRMDDRFYLLLKLEQWQRETQILTGAELARFHYHGFHFSGEISSLNRLGRWQEYWEVRLTQLEKMHEKVLRTDLATKFDESFVLSFPYYAGLAENALQYFTDTILDTPLGTFDRGTICHERFNANTWSEKSLWKNPFDWVFDHPARDLAEYIRPFILQEGAGLQHARTFLKEYQTYLQLSSMTWRLLYSRLLFPIHYFEIVEDYYFYPEKKEKEVLFNRLQRYLAISEKYERILGDFQRIFDVSIERTDLPIPEWLVK